MDLEVGVFLPLDLLLTEYNLYTIWYRACSSEADDKVSENQECDSLLEEL